MPPLAQQSPGLRPPVAGSERSRASGHEVDTSRILVARVLAAALNVAPPLVGSVALGREMYGMVASVLALATIVFGPVSQILSQNLLRVLCTAQRGERVIAAALLFCTACVATILVAHLAGWLSPTEAAQLAVLVVSLTLLRICEVHLISSGRIVRAIAVFYAAPPLLSSAFYLAAGAIDGSPVAAALAQSLAYCVAAAGGIYAAHGVKTVLVHALRTPVGSVARELAQSGSLMLAGATSAASDFLPALLLRSLDALAVIPIYEVARKIASVPTTIANPLLNQTNPAVIRAYATSDRGEIRRLLRRLFRALLYPGVGFGCFVVATLVAGSFIPRVSEVGELLLPLSVGTLVSMWCLPYQSVLIAARGDRWFSLSSAVSVVLLLAVTYGAGVLGPGRAVAWAVAVSVAVGGLIVRHRALKEARRLERRGDDGLSSPASP
jgi:O-antigen/teichoic acid export membrane protein